jgi:hypothetical protein
MSGFYELRDDMTRADRWFLSGLVDQSGYEIDPRIFTYAERLDIKPPFRLSQEIEGEPLDFTLSDFDLPVLRREFAEKLQELAPNDIQRFPVLIDGTHDQYDIINVLSLVRCLDHQRSELTYSSEEDSEPDEVGEVEMVVRLRIHQDQVGSHHVFRIREWQVPLIVSEAVKTILTSAVGPILTPV